jgi:hypothetical protein
VTFRIINKIADPLLLRVAKGSAAIFVLQAVKCMMRTAAHAYGQGDALTAFLISEWIVGEPFDQSTV